MRLSIFRKPAWCKFAKWK